MPCFSKGTMIGYPNQHPMAVEELRAGSRLTCFAGDGSIRISPVIGNKCLTSPEVIEINDKLIISPDHPLYSIGMGWVAARELQFGDLVLGIYGVTEVLSVRFHRLNTEVFDLVLDGVFSANGYLTISKRLNTDQRRAFNMNRIMCISVAESKQALGCRSVEPENLIKPIFGSRQSITLPSAAR